MKLILTSTLFFVLAVFGGLQAQDDEQQIRSLLQEVSQLASNIKTPQDVQKLKSYYTPNYSAIRTDYLVDGSHSSTSTTMEGVGSRLSGVSTDIDQTLEYKIDQISYLKVLGNTAVVNYTAPFSLSNKGEVVFGGTQVITARLVKTDTGWKISSSTVAEVRDNIQKYVCNYELYSKDASTALLKVQYPTGTAFATEFADITIEDIGNKSFIVKINNRDQFRWDNGKLELPGREGAPTKMITAGTRTAVYSELIKYYFPQQCPDAKLKN